MEIKVIHEIRFAKETSNLVELVAAALTGALNGSPQQVTETKAADKVEDIKVKKPTEKLSEDPKANVAEKIRYFQHEGSGDLIKVAKGESLDFLGDDIFDELKPVDYNRLLAEQKKAEAEAQQEANATTEDDTTTDDAAVPTVEDLRVVAAKFQRNKQQKELKEILDKFGAPKLSAIKEKDRAEALQLMTDKANELELK